MKIAILGFGCEGKAILKYLKNSAQYKNADISILDKKIDKNYLLNLINFNIIFRYRGVPYNLPEIKNAIKKGVIFSSSTDLFFKNAKKIGCKIIGITGTKGKGTTATLLYKILKADKKDVHLVGNIGKPAVEILPKLDKKSVVIFELSSFQLQDLKYSPDIAVILNIFEDHLDSHKNFKEYIEAKANIAKWQKKSDKIFYDADNKWSHWVVKKSISQKFPVLIENLKLFNIEKIKMLGVHNLKNAVMAAMVAKNLEIKKNIIKKVIKNFKGMEHRLELVHSNVFENVGINFYNDSASTNPYTAVAAIKSFKEPNVLIAGGKDKGLDYTPLANALKNSNTKLIILFGENKKKIVKVISKIKNKEFKIIEANDLKSAVNLAHKTAKSLATGAVAPHPLIAVLFSPASASFDMFKDYKDRGKKFKEIVKGLK